MSASASSLTLSYDCPVKVPGDACGLSFTFGAISRDPPLVLCGLARPLPASLTSVALNLSLALSPPPLPPSLLLSSLAAAEAQHMLSTRILG